MLVVESPDGSLGRPVNGYPSTHILKLDNRIFPGLVRAEHRCLELARAAGISAAESRLVAIGPIECILVKRFDRVAAANGSVARIHQEDACQALGIDPERNQRRAKYLAPLYDTVPTRLWPALRGEAAMNIGGATQLAAVTGADIIQEAAAWPISPGNARDCIESVVTRMIHDTASDDDAVATSVRDRAHELLSSLT